MSLLLKIVSQGSEDKHKTFPDSEYDEALVVMEAWFELPKTDGCVLFLMSDGPKEYSHDWVEICRMKG